MPEGHWYFLEVTHVALVADDVAEGEDFLAGRGAGEAGLESEVQVAVLEHAL